MKALITGASSGLGYDMAKVLSEKGYDIIAVARRTDRLEKLKNELKTNVEIICCDVTVPEQCMALAEKASGCDIFINNAGFGVFGAVCSSPLEDELRMMDTNVRAVHILTKLVAQKFTQRGYGHIMNVGSLASFFPGPLFGAYYATKAYVLRYSQALAQELRSEKSKVKISVLCPGPVNTEFADVAKVSFGKASGVILESRFVAEYAIKKMLKGKEVIIPGFVAKAAIFARHFVSDKVLAKAVFFVQSKKFAQK